LQFGGGPYILSVRLSHASLATKTSERASYLREEATMSKPCQEYANLQHEVQLTLQALTDLTRAMLDAFHAPDRDRFKQLDRELEMMVGRKERTIGALRQHVKEHKCAGPHLP
jgi:hypothetical protein